MVEAINLREQLADLEECMTHTVVTLKQFSSRLESGEIVDLDAYNDLARVISNLSAVQEDFCTALSDMSNYAKRPLNIKEAKVLVEAVGSKLYKESLKKLSERSKSISAKERYADSLSKLVGDLDRLCGQDQLENASAVVSAYENLFRAVTIENPGERLQVLEQCEPYIDPKIINAVSFSGFSLDEERTPVLVGATGEAENPEKAFPANISDNMPQDVKSLNRSNKATEKTTSRDAADSEEKSKLDLLIKNPNFPYDRGSENITYSNTSHVGREIDVEMMLRGTVLLPRIRLGLNNDNGGSAISAGKNIKSPDKAEDKAHVPVSEPLKAADGSTGSAKDGTKMESSAANERITDEDHILRNKSVPIETVMENILRMFRDGKLYCACAYLRVLCKNDPANSLYPLYSKLAYAAYDPTFDCKYDSSTVMTIFENIDPKNGELDNDLYLAAALRTLFYCDSNRDYSYEQLFDMVKVTAESISSAIRDLIYELVVFRKEASVGIDAFANYRLKKQQEYKHLMDTRTDEARQFYETFIIKKVSEAAKLKPLVDTQKAMFARNSDLAACINFIIGNDNDDNEALDFVTEFLDTNNFGKASEYALKIAIDEYIDKFWKSVTKQKNPTPLSGSLRNNLSKRLDNIIRIIKDWVECKQYLGSFVSAGRYEKEKGNIYNKINTALSECKAVLKNGSVHDGLACLISTLEEFQARMNGSFFDANRRFFYVDFLKYGYVMLDENFLPENDEYTQFLDGFSPAERIAEHSQRPDRSFEERIAEIFGSDELLKDDYGCAHLIKNYLETIGSADRWNVQYDIDDFCEPAKAQCESNHRKFIETLELAQCYGKIPLIETKENIRRREELIYKRTLETDNYGYFLRFTKACEEFIAQDAKTRATALKLRLESIGKEYNGSEADKKSVETLIARANEQLELQDYTVVEDIINRIERKDLDDYTVDISSSDTFDIFIREFDDIYNSVKDTARYGAKAITPPYDSPHNKEEKAANDLVMSFPYSGNVGENKIKTLLGAMGFNCKSVSLSNAAVQKATLFDVQLNRPLNNTKQSYTHVIAPFGSLAVENGFRVVCLFGGYQPETLIKKFGELGETQNCMVILDSPLSLVERRELAYRAKKEAFSKVFIAVDAVVTKFLSKYYKEAKVNLNLMEITMPFSNYQPYYDSASTLLPVEMFMGRYEQLKSIKTAEGANIVYGGRQLGKTALLKMAKNDIDHNEKGDRAVYIDAKDYGCQKVSKMLSERLVSDGILANGCITDDWETLCVNIRNRLINSSEEDRIPFLLILIDEADTFIEDCKNVKYEPIRLLKNIQQEGVGRFKFVIAGLHNVVKFERKSAESNNSVLPHLQSLNIAPFSAAEARELLETPLRTLGIRFPKDKAHLIPTILASTNYFPGLIHTYCFKLIEAMQNKTYAGYDSKTSPPYNINEDHFQKVLGDPNFNLEVNQKFTITLELGEDRYYYIISYILAYLLNTSEGKSGFTAKEVYSTGRSYEVKKFANLDEDSVAALMDEMCDLNVLSYNRNQETYSFARHRFVQMLSAKDIDQEILSFSEA